MPDKKPPKGITQSSLVRIFKDIKANKSKEPRFCFLIGAGASRSSGIPSGWELSKQWYNDLKDELTNPDEIKFWEKRIGAPFNIDNVGHFYPFLYEKRYESCPENGYGFFKKLMADTDPSIGYIILANILDKENHKFVITTNFDYLIEDAVRMFTATKPFIAGHETLAEFISSQAERPTIIKVHRDLFLHPFNDDETTCELKEEWKKALSPVLKNFYLLVIGYGGNDGSLMDYLSELGSLNRQPIYWCIRDKRELNSKIENLLTEKDFVVTIDGFDELMYALNKALEYTLFNDLGKPDEHPFVIHAKNRIISIDEKLKTLISKAKDKKEIISQDVKNLITGSLSYIVNAYSEQDPDKKEEIYKEGINKYPQDADLLSSYASFLYDIEKVSEGNDYYKKALEIKPDKQEALYNWGTDLGNLAKTKEGKEAEDLYQQAFEKFQKALEIKPDLHEALYNWGNYLGNLAKTKGGKEAEDLYQQAFEKFQKALEIKPDLHEALYNWGNYLGNLAKTKESKEAEDLYQQAFEKYQKALEIKPDLHEALNNWGTDLGNLAKTKEGKEAADLYRQAFEKFQKAYEYGGRCYNLACFYAIKRDKENALKYLDISFDKNENQVDFVLKDDDWKYYLTDKDFLKLIEKYRSS